MSNEKRSITLPTDVNTSKDKVVRLANPGDFVAFLLMQSPIEERVRWDRNAMTRLPAGKDDVRGQDEWILGVFDVASRVPRVLTVSKRTMEDLVVLMVAHGIDGQIYTVARAEHGRKTRYLVAHHGKASEKVIEEMAMAYGNDEYSDRLDLRRYTVGAQEKGEATEADAKRPDPMAVVTAATERLGS